jgi:broad specificity phosphatase PhoE
LHLIRHGQASFGADDYDNLSPKGIEQSVALGEALSQQESKFDHVIVGPHRRHIQTFEGIKKGYKFADLPDPVIDERFAENQLMEIAQHFIPQILNSNKTTNEIYHVSLPWELHEKFHL